MCVSSEPTVNEHYDPAVSTKAALYIISLKYRKLSLITRQTVPGVHSMYFHV